MNVLAPILVIVLGVLVTIVATAFGASGSTSVGVAIWVAIVAYVGLAIYAKPHLRDKD
jgi:hypothetical protein